jgi:hypothetical protein
MEKPNAWKLFSLFLLPALVSIASKSAYGQGPPVNSPKARANGINNVLRFYGVFRPRFFVGTK